jgi:hypothetical protein
MTTSNTSLFQKLKSSEEVVAGAAREWCEETDQLSMEIVEPITVFECKFDVKATDNEEVLYVTWLDITNVQYHMLRNSKSVIAIEQQVRVKQQAIERILHELSLRKLNDDNENIELKVAPKLDKNVSNYTLFTYIQWLLCMNHD